MTVDVATLKPYQKRLYDLIADVGEGEEVGSGAPLVENITRAQYDALIANKDKARIVNEP